MKPIIVHGVGLEVEKTHLGFVKVHYKGFRLCEELTRKACLAAMDKDPRVTDKDQFVKAIEYADAEIAKREAWPKLSKKFNKIFGFAPPLCWAMAMMKKKSLDVVKLDDVLKVPDGESMLDFITEEYGEDAANLCQEMI